MVFKNFFLAILLLGVAIAEDDSPLKISKNLYPKKYQPIALKKYRTNPTEAPITTTSETPEGITENIVETSSENPGPDLMDLTLNDEEFIQAMSRPKKSATTTFCVEIRPSNPRQKPFQVCEPSYQPSYQPKYLPAYQPAHQPEYAPSQPAYGYGSSHSGYGPSHPQAQPSGPGYGRPVMVLPHVPVAEPYHVPKIVYKPSSSGGTVYRTSNGEEIMLNSGEVESNSDKRTAYYSPYEGGYDEGKKKEYSYLPIITHKTKPVKYLKVLKDLKKDKVKFYEEEYYRPSYHHPSYDNQDSGSHKEGSSSHGLVITCQPSAVGYTGQQSKGELAKHMELLKNIYSQTEKLYNQQTLSSSPEAGGGYVAPGTYRSAEGDRVGAKSGGGWNALEGTMRSSKWQGIEAEPQGDPNLGGKKYQPTQIDDNIKTSSGPSPTIGMMGPQEIETSAAFKAAHHALAIRQEMHNNRM